MGQPRWFWAVSISLLAAAGCTERGEVGPPDARPGLDAGGGDAAAPECRTDLDCADRIACSIDHCEAGACVHAPCTDCCDEGLVCEASLGCVRAPESCTTDDTCGDMVRCTLDSCRDATSCEHRPQDGLCAAGEICLAAVGCIPAPPTSCTTAADCNVGAACVGEWDCEPEFGCVFVSTIDCDDGDACTADACVEEMGGCVNALLDDDGDGHAPTSCAGGDDCDDASAARHPGAVEACDGALDEDCDELVDEGCCTVAPCTTSCGTTGTIECPSGTCVPPAETCDGTDENCDGTIDEGFGCVEGTTRTCGSGCTGVQTCTGCTWGACAFPAETCNGADDDCDGSPDDGFACVQGATTSCTTSCGTSGTSICSSACTAGACAPPAETCNGGDDDCDGLPDDDFACVRGVASACTTSCGSIGSRICGTDCTLPAACTPPAEACNAADDDCDGAPDDDFECVRGTSAACTTTCGSIGVQTCRAGTCTYGACTPPAETCNGVDDDCDTACDDGFTCCRGSTRDCTALGFFAGTAVCRSDCGAFDTATCTNCGNGVRDAGEACDGTALGGATCTSIPGGFTGGMLRCGAGCTYDTSMCTRCGNGVRETGEQCDDGNTANGDGCSSTCQTEVMACDPDGTYLLGAPVSYTCCAGLVSVNVSSFSLSLDGARITSSPSNPVPMTGAATTCPAGSFNATGTIAGGCTETYSLRGSFTGPNTWTGFYDVTFTGSDCGCFGGAFGTPCVNQSFPVTATR